MKVIFMITRAQMMRKSVDNDTKTAKERLSILYGRHLKKVVFGKIRNDGTRGAKVYFNDGEMMSYSYLTDIRKPWAGVGGGVV
jgi:hypothetical protein